jgi:aminoglycoside phosphotransferase family enzyme/predicted kinase
MHLDVLKALHTPTTYPHSVDSVTHLETHISHIFLAGDYAYKLKKPVDFGFLNFSTLELRKHYCLREVELNTRFAPDLYLGVLALIERNGSLSLTPIEQEDDSSPVIDYLVQMRRFDDSSLLIHSLQMGRLNSSHIRSLARDIAALHSGAKPRPEYGAVCLLEKHCEENFQVVEEYGLDLISEEELQASRKGIQNAVRNHGSLIEKRAHTHVKELHGDLHLKNIFLENDTPKMFDGIEFNEEYLCRDVWSDVAFLAMDLVYNSRPDLAVTLINEYLETTDDFEGLLILPLHLSYLAGVRAKVNLLKRADANSKETHSLSKAASAHFRLARQALTERSSITIAIGGLSGSGKTTLARELSSNCGLVHIRSDVVRKHLSNTPPANQLDDNSYTEEARNRIYEAILERAKICVKANFNPLLDATFTSPHQQALVEGLTDDVNTFIGLWCTVPEEVALKRIQERTGDASDADSSVFRQQQQSFVLPLRWQAVDTTNSPERTVSRLLSELPALNTIPHLLSS